MSHKDDLGHSQMFGWDAADWGLTRIGVRRRLHYMVG